MGNLLSRARCLVASVHVIFQRERTRSGRFRGFKPVKVWATNIAKPTCCDRSRGPGRGGTDTCHPGSTANLSDMRTNKLRDSENLNRARYGVSLRNKSI
jgi:hypothetical protein